MTFEQCARHIHSSTCIFLLKVAEDGNVYVQLKYNSESHGIGDSKSACLPNVVISGLFESFTINYSAYSSVPSDFCSRFL